MRGQWRDMGSAVTDDMVRAFAVIGTYDEIAAKMKQRLAGCTRFGFDMPTRTETERGIARDIVQDLHRAAP
jgi:alkanesulfonate monooxygenase SsuD/methylene tetrahydromethanopterin reductase-like flavin-dependent oxidoreductase (luciferase family)